MVGVQRACEAKGQSSPSPPVVAGLVRILSLAEMSNIWVSRQGRAVPSDHWEVLPGERVPPASNTWERPHRSAGLDARSVRCHIAIEPGLGLLAFGWRGKLTSGQGSWLLGGECLLVSSPNPASGPGSIPFFLSSLFLVCSSPTRGLNNTLEEEGRFASLPRSVVWHKLSTSDICIMWVITSWAGQYRQQRLPD